MKLLSLLCSKNANVNLADKDGDTCLHEALRHHTLSQLKQLQDVGDSGRLINIFTNTNGYDKRPSVAIACTLVMHGADLSAKNKKNQKPFDLCPDPHLCRILTEKHIEYNRENNNDQQLSQNTSLTECLVCSDNERDTLFQPCSHVVTCHLCASRVKKCLLCKENIQTRIKIEQCKLCSQRKASVMYKPCGHLIACEECAGLTEKCFVCRVAIDSIVSFNELCCGNNDSVSIKSETPTTPTPTPSNDVSDAIALARLQQQLQEIREQVHCPIYQREKSDNTTNNSLGESKMSEDITHKKQRTENKTNAVVYASNESAHIGTISKRQMGRTTTTTTTGTKKRMAKSTPVTEQETNALNDADDDNENIQNNS
ncbi:unnamed protein product [Rotaria sp. Silwood1]|nr:unnamed protein product [Rotaria sp. Silwood1]